MTIEIRLANGQKEVFENGYKASQWLNRMKPSKKKKKQTKQVKTRYNVNKPGGDGGKVVTKDGSKVAFIMPEAGNEATS